ncbi:MAG TPA: hypothetical protein VM513_07105 [Kofleriaceae bacterium]|jgi:hypothetical protein|nr:hypothetical protein [Kofleriaceae bacterium]
MASYRDRAVHDHALPPLGNHATPHELSPGAPDQEVAAAPTQRLARGSIPVVSGPRMEWDSPRDPTPEELANTEPFGTIDLDEPDVIVAARSRLPLVVLALALLAVTLAIVLAAS